MDVSRILPCYNFWLLLREIWFINFMILKIPILVKVKKKKSVILGEETHIYSFFLYITEVLLIVAFVVFHIFTWKNIQLYRPWIIINSDV